MKLWVTEVSSDLWLHHWWHFTNIIIIIIRIVSSSSSIIVNLVSSHLVAATVSQTVSVLNTHSLLQCKHSSTIQQGRQSTMKQNRDVNICICYIWGYEQQCCSFLIKKTTDKCRHITQHDIHNKYFTQSSSRTQTLWHSDLSVSDNITRYRIICKILKLSLLQCFC